MSVLDIPELLLATLGYLDQSSLGKCAQVCRAWREPATELLWAQVQDLECLVNKSFTKNALSCFSNPAWNRLIHKPYPELASPPNSPRGDDQPEGTEPTLAQAWCELRSFDVDWIEETKLFRMRTQRITHICLTRSSLHALLVLYALQEICPMACRGIFPRLFALTIGNDHYAPLTSQSITRLTSLRHITYEASSANLYSTHFSSWRVACQDAIGLTSFSIRFTGESDNKEYFGGFLEPYWAYSKNLSPSLSRFPFVLSRPWKHIELPGRLVGKYLFSALASISTLETLTIHGSLKSSGEDIKYKGALFKSLRELRLLDVSTIGEEYFTGLVLHNVRDLELRYLPEREKVTSATILPTVNLAAMAQACPNLLTLIVTANDIAEEGKFGAHLFPSTIMAFFARAGYGPGAFKQNASYATGTRAVFPVLPEAVLTPARNPAGSHSHRLQRRLILPAGYQQPWCQVLAYIPKHWVPVHLQGRSRLRLLSALFPNLRQIECPKPSGSVPYSQGDYFVWSQVVRTVQELDRDLEYLARTLRARDLAERHESINGEFIVSSIDDSDEDYWAYSGSEDDSYSSDED
ncbi:hypothetical protein RHS01_04819 [Rhizoctonia solani]|uniref:F-box domain-containing protein n=1 Tax=Rhizoctonia solani TaxID=456999 RepID=A0A8H7IE68_9AGAM|nr:hypothetical protein RHS01_04819 [Rhizoctonia solani]